MSFLLIILGVLGGLGLPMGMSPGEEDVRMHQIAPDKTIAYVTWSGIREPKPDANPTEKWLANAKVKLFRNKLRAALFPIGSWHPDERVEPELTRSCAALAFHAAINNPTAIYVRDFDKIDFTSQAAPKFSSLAAIKLGDDLPAFQKDYAAWQEAIKNDDAGYRNQKLLKLKNEKGSVIQAEVRPNRSSGLTDATIFLMLKDDLLLIGSSTQEIELALKNLNTPSPDWLKELRQELDIEQVSSMAYLDVQQTLVRIPKAAAEFRSLGLYDDSEISNQVKTLSNVTGMTPMGFTSRSKLTTLPGVDGFLDALGDRPLTEQELGSLKDDALTGFAIRINGPAVLGLIKKSLSSSAFKRQLDAALGEMEEFSGEKLETEFVKGIGDFVAFQGNADFFNPRFDWRMSISIKEVMTFPDLIFQLSEAIKELADEQELGDIKKRTYENNRFYMYEAQRGWQRVGWSVLDERIVIGQQPVEELATPTPLPNEDQLAKTPAMVQLLAYGKEKKLGNPIGIFSLNVPKAIAKTRTMLNGFLTQDTEIVSGVDLKFSDIPPAEIWSDNMAPHLTAIYRVEDGFVFHQTQTIPGSNWVTTVFAANLGFWLIDLR